MLIIILPMSKAERKLISEPDTLSRGFVDRDFSELRRDVNRLTTQTVNKLQEANRNQWNVMKKQIKKSIREYVYTHTKKNPMIVPILIEI